MDKPNLLTRIAAPVLPLIIIALIFGGAGYALKKQPVSPIPPLPAAENRVPGARGILQSIAGDQISLTTDDGKTLNYKLAPNAPVEALRPSSLAEVSAGDWLNGGATDHADTVLALVGLIIIPDPVVTP